jgi:hypothetical protein
VPGLTGNPAIDTALGLAFVYFLLSLVVSSLTEVISAVLQLRWRTLRRGIRELLLEGRKKSRKVLRELDQVNKALTALDRDDLKKAKKIAEKLSLGLPANYGADELRKRLLEKYPRVSEFENNERIKALWKQTGFLASVPGIGNRGPSYIEPRTFALTLLETLGEIADEETAGAATPDSGQTDAEQRAAEAAALQLETDASELSAKSTPSWMAAGPDQLVVDAARAVVTGAANPVLEKWLRDAIIEAQGKRDKLLESIESSFDAMTNRISGWYKRYATIWIFLISAAVAVALNADSYAMGSRLWKDQAVRSTLVAQADKLADPETCEAKTPSEQADDTTTSTRPPTESTETNGTTEGTDATDTTDMSETSAPSPSGNKSEPIEEAKTAIQRASDCVTAVEALGLPLGWAKANRPDTASDWVGKFGGIFITVFALMLGAPFWFDTLSKLARLRATGKPEGTATKSD